MSKEKRNQWGGLIAKEPGGYEREHGSGHPLVDERVLSGGGVPAGFRLRPSRLVPRDEVALQRLQRHLEIVYLKVQVKPAEYRLHDSGDCSCRGVE